MRHHPPRLLIFAAAIALALLACCSSPADAPPAPRASGVHALLSSGVDPTPAFLGMPVLIRFSADRTHAGFVSRVIDDDTVSVVSGADRGIWDNDTFCDSSSCPTSYTETATRGDGLWQWQPNVAMLPAAAQ